MKAKASRSAGKAARPSRRLPQQRRARQTVDAILEAVTRVLQREGVEAVTTNRIAVAAGVSIGSVYQYFPDKRAIFAALHERHVEAIDRVIARTLVEQAAAPLEELLGALVAALIEAHRGAPELHALVFAQLPQASTGERSFEARLHGLLRLALSARADELGLPRQLDRVLFVVTHMIESLCHGAVLRRPPRLSLAAAKEETVRALLAYLRAVAPARSASSAGMKEVRARGVDTD